MLRMNAHCKLCRSRNLNHKFYAAFKSTSICLQIQIEFSIRRCAQYMRALAPYIHTHTNTSNHRVMVSGCRWCIATSTKMPTNFQTQFFLSATISLNIAHQTQCARDKKNLHLNERHTTNGKSIRTRQDNQINRPNERTYERMNWKWNSDWIYVVCWIVTTFCFIHSAINLNKKAILTSTIHFNCR